MGRVMSEDLPIVSDVPPTPQSQTGQGLSEVSDVSEVGAPARVSARTAHASRAHTSQSISRVYTGDTSDTSDKLEPVRVSDVGRTSDVAGEPPTSQKRRGSLRETMPTVAAFIDEMREVFGADEINASIKAGLSGQPTFWASENGVEVGTKDTRPGLPLSEMVIGPPGAIVQAGMGRK